MSTVIGFAEKIDAELREVLGRSITDLADSPADSMDKYQRRLGVIEGYRTALAIIEQQLAKLTAVRTNMRDV